MRKALTHDNYTDIDIVNCHPVLLSQLFKKHNLECPYLDEYIENREEHLETIIPLISNTVDELPDSYVPPDRLPTRVVLAKTSVSWG